MGNFLPQRGYYNILGKLRQICAIILAVKKGIILILALFFAALPCAAEFKDIPAGHGAYPAVKKLLENGIISLPPDRKFFGSAAVDRYQVAYILDKILEFTSKLRETEARPLEEFYIDIPRKHYAYKAVQDLVKLGLYVIPESKRFEGEAQVNRYYFYSYFAAFLEGVEGRRLPTAPAGAGYSDIPADNPYYPYIQKLIGAGLLEGKGRFDGDGIVTRYEMVTFAALILDYYILEKGKEERVAVVGYVDIPKGHYAAEAVSKLVEAGVLSPGEGKEFFGERLINRYLLVDFISKVIEGVLMEEGMILEEANPALAYKDVPVSNFAYHSIQKLIALGIIPPGNRIELFHGDRKINRYQMVFFTFSAIEYVLSEVIAFQAAHSSLGYWDVPRDHFVYETIQKLIWLDVLEGGQDRNFNGEEYVNRYELCYFTVKLIEAVVAKLEEIREEVYQRPVGYGFETFLNTQLDASQITSGKGTGEALNDLNAYQVVDISIDRRVNRYLSVFASLSSRYYFGDDITFSSPFLDQAYLLVDYSPFIFQVGRQDLYQGLTPFGNSLYIDTSSSDMILANYDHRLFNLSSAIGKIVYQQDLSLDSNFGTLSLAPRLPGKLSWLELFLGTSFITNLPDPTFTFSLPATVVQAYGGLRINLFNLFEFTYENAKLDFSDPSVLASVGTEARDDPQAYQYALTYFSEDYGYSLSAGYQKIGDDYYLCTLADPTDFLSSERNTESYLFKTRYYPDARQAVGAELNYIIRDEYNIKTALSGYYDLQVFEAAYLKFLVTKIMDNTSARQDELSLSSSFSFSL